MKLECVSLKYAIQVGTITTTLHQGLLTRTKSVDQPVAALLADLQQRGMLEDTLVLFGSEFGRLPQAQGPDGRDHNITGYPMWLAGAGVKPGFSFGANDEYGREAVEGRMHTNDLHATIPCADGAQSRGADLSVCWSRLPINGRSGARLRPRFLLSSKRLVGHEVWRDRCFELTSSVKK